MAEILRDNPEYDYVQCEPYYLRDGQITAGHMPHPTTIKTERITTEQYLFNVECRASWAMMVRKNFMDKIGMIENYYTDTRFSHEPYFFVPLSACGARVKMLYHPLYIYRVGVEDSHSFQNIEVDFEKHQKYGENYFELVNRCLDGLDEQYCDKATKDRIRRILPLAKYHWYIERYRNLERTADCPEFIYMHLFDEIQNIFGVKLNRLDYIGRETEIVNAVNYFIGDNKNAEKTRNISNIKRVVAVGALGKRMRIIFPKLKGTPLEPTDFWDENGLDCKTPGVYAVKPDFSSLTADDVLLALPKALEETDYYKDLPCKVLFMKDILETINKPFFKLGLDYACE
jgi:hypothetical protein